MRLINQTVVITGGTSGIGRELVKQLYPNNRVIVLGRDSDTLHQLRITFPGIDTFTVELTDTQALEETLYALSQRYDTVDLLINGAAVQHTPTFLDANFDFSSIEYEIKLNFTAVCQTIYLLLERLRGDSPSIILNINSGLAIAPKTSSAIYCGTKGGLDLFSRSLQYQLEGTNIKVLQVFLPVVDTPMTAGRAETKKISAETAAQEILQGIQNEIPQHDVGKVALLRWLVRLFPSLARRIMKRY